MTNIPQANQIQPDTKLPKTKKQRRYVALLTQTGTADPVQKVLTNNLYQTDEEFFWTRDSAGVYHGDIGVDKDLTNAAVLIANTEVGTIVQKGTDEPPHTLIVTTGLDDKLDSTTIVVEMYDTE